jgi:hypothetical protein
MCCSQSCADFDVTQETHVYEIRLRKDKRSFDLISDALPFDRLWYGEPNAISNAIGYAKSFSRSHDAVIRDEAGNVIETHEHAVSSKNRERFSVGILPQGSLNWWLKCRRDKLIRFNDLIPNRSLQATINCCSVSQTTNNPPKEN